VNTGLVLSPLWFAAMCAVLAIALLRFAWSTSKRSIALNGMAWGALFTAMALSAVVEGAWGMAIVSLCAMGMAALCLAYAAWTAPPGKAAVPAGRMKQEGGRTEPLQLGHRGVTFLVTVPAALLVAMAVALAARELANRAGLHEANSALLAFLSMPLIWAILIFALLFWPRRRAQFMLLGGLSCAALALLAVRV